MGVTALRFVIHGRVQGVGFRHWTAGRAFAQGLTGWVRNRRDGTVEALICGEDALVQSMFSEIGQGPLAAKVTQVDASIWGGEIPGEFQRLPTL